MTPQELMDLPHYGMAERQLRKEGRWQIDPSEKLRMIVSKVYDINCDLEHLNIALEGNA